MFADSPHDLSCVRRVVASLPFVHGPPTSEVHESRGGNFEGWYLWADTRFVIRDTAVRANLVLVETQILRRDTVQPRTFEVSITWGRQLDAAGPALLEQAARS